MGNLYDTVSRSEVAQMIRDALRMQNGPRTPRAHSTNHQGGGSDQLAVTSLAGFPGGTTDFLRADGSFATPPGGGGAHASDHEDGGGDEIDLTGLSGVPAVLPDPAGGDDDDVVTVSGGVYVLAPASGGPGSLPDWLALHPDAPPTSPDAADDEFLDDSGQSGPVNGLDSKWSFQNQQSTTVAFEHGCLVLVRPANAGSANHVILKQAIATPTGDYTFRVKVSAWPLAAGFHVWGIVLRESATGKCVVVGHDWSNSSTEYRLACRSFTGDTGGSSSLAGINTGSRAFFAGHHYFQVRKSGSTLFYEYSFDGVRFHALHSQPETTSFTTRPDQIGLHIDINGHANALTVIYESFRKVA